MNYIIEFCSYIFTRIINILDSISLPGSLSLLHYFLGAIIIGFIFRLVKGGATEFEANTNFLNSRIVSGYAAKYANKHNERMKQVINQKKVNDSFVYGFVAGNEFADGDSDIISRMADMAGYKSYDGYKVGK